MTAQPEHPLHEVQSDSKLMVRSELLKRMILMVKITDCSHLSTQVVIEER